MNVHNCSDIDIVLRYLPKPGLKGGRVLVLPGGSALITDIKIPSELHAATAANEDRAFAHLNIDQLYPDVHFTQTGGGYGKGVYAQPTFVREQLPTALATGDESLIVSLTPDQPKDTTTMEAEQPVEVPGLGLILLSSLKPEIRKQVMERIAIAQQQQQPHTSREGGALPRYTRSTAVVPKLQNTSSTSSIVYPSIILILIVVAFVYLTTREGRAKKRR